MSRQVDCLYNASHDDVHQQLQSGRFFWLDVEDASPDHIQELGELLGLHPITIEDAQRFDQRSRYDDYPDYAAMVVLGVDPGATSGTHLLREVHMVMAGTYILTIHKRPMQVLDDLRKRYAQTEVRSEQFLIYKILDAISQTFFPVLERIDDDIDEIEESVIDNPDQAALQRIFGLKRDLVAMRRVVTPSRDVFAHHLERLNDLPGMEQDDQFYFRDLYDTLVRVSDMVDSYRDLLSGATDLYLSTVANRQGEINKSLTIIATIFLPLTFLTGFFGQNFTALTGHVLTHQWAFWWLGVGLEVLAVVLFLVYFRTRRWM